jgi:lysophospholipase L1-like esterase
MATRLLGSLALAVTLAACGGGGTGPESTPAQAVSASTCRVSVLLNGDSTMWGYAPGGGARAAVYPESELQRLMDARFGTGAVTVRTGAVPGSTSTDALTQPRGADLVLFNPGINDAAYGHAPETFRTNLLALAAVHGAVLVTPLPVQWLPGYDAITREVAAATGVPLIDARAYAESRTDWWQIATDGVHPDVRGYALLARDVLAPALVPMVEARCHDQVAM